MNTRFRKMKPIPEKPSVKWHLMHEEYYPLFAPERREQVECWYNKTATGKQRDVFRRICKEMYEQDPGKGVGEYAAEYTRQVALCEAKMMLRHYGAVLSDLGKQLAWVWILHVASVREKDNFREIFTGAQSSFIPQTVMKADYVAPDAETYEEIDRTNFLCSINWANPQAQEARRKIHEDRFHLKRVSIKTDKPRVTKPKNQFDGVSPLMSLGYTGMSEEEIMAELRRKLDENMESDRYYTVDGCTVYVAGKSKKMDPNAASDTKRNVMATVCGD